MLFSECNWGFNNLQREKFLYSSISMLLLHVVGRGKGKCSFNVKAFQSFSFHFFCIFTSLHFCSLLSLCVYPPFSPPTVVFYIIFYSFHFLFLFLSFIKKKPKMNTKIKVFFFLSFHKKKRIPQMLFRCYSKGLIQE